MLELIVSCLDREIHINEGYKRNVIQKWSLECTNRMVSLVKKQENNLIWPVCGQKHEELNAAESNSWEKFSN